MNLSKTVFIRIGIVLPIFVLIFLSNVSSQALGTWAFNGSTAGTAGSYNTVSNADFSPSVASKGYSGSVYYGEMNWSAGGINTNDYFQFSLTPVAGHSLNILSVVLSMRRSSTGSPAGSGPRSFSVRSSLDNYTTDLLTASLTHNIANYTITPSGFNLLSSTVTFRVYGYNAANSSGGLNRLVFDNISVTGSNIVLADEQTSVSAKNQNGRVNIYVSLKNVFSSNTYTIERSADAVNFIPVNKIDPAKIVNDIYTYSDIPTDHTAGKLYYRLSIKKENGRVEYSNISTVSIEQAKTRLKLYTRGNTITISSDLKGACTFMVLSSSGACVYKKEINDAAVNNTLLLPNLPAGIYYGSLLSNNIVRTAAIRLGTIY